MPSDYTSGTGNVSRIVEGKTTVNASTSLSFLEKLTTGSTGYRLGFHVKHQTAQNMSTSRKSPTMRIKYYGNQRFCCLVGIIVILALHLRLAHRLHHAASLNLLSYRATYKTIVILASVVMTKYIP